MPGNGPAASGDDGDDLMLALQTLSGRREADAKLVEAAFVGARDSEVSLEQFLADDGRRLSRPSRNLRWLKSTSAVPTATGMVWGRSMAMATGGTRRRGA